MGFPVDTLLYDSAKIAGYQADRRFDYNRQLGVQNINLMERLNQWIERFMRMFFDNETAAGISSWFLIVFFVLVVGLIVFLVYKKRPELFIREKKKPLPYEVEEETIYGIDFEKELNSALAAGDFRMAIRMLYLQTLRFVADKEWIDWQIYKTPTEYTYELKPAALKLSFRSFTNRFLQVRYGNFRATRELFDAMRHLQNDIKKGGHGESDGE